MINQKPTYKSGFVNIIGCPNVGKSTLMNAIIGEKLSIVTPKAQTTRHRVMGILNTDDYQIVFSDTPGVIKPVYKLQEKMMQFVVNAISDADIFLLMIDVTSNILLEETFISNLIKAQKPIIILLNKIDLITQEALEIKAIEWNEKIPNSNIFPISALQNFNLNTVLNKILEYLPIGEAFYEKDALTDKSERFFVSEIIREKILIQYKKEIPYSVEIKVISFKNEANILKIQAEILVERESQKAILLGHQGQSLKRMATRARIDAEKFFDKKIFLELYIKVVKDWRSNENALKEFGY